MDAPRPGPPGNLLTAILRRPLVIIATTLLAAIVGFAAAGTRAAVYVATAEALLSDPSQGDVLNPGGRVDNVRFLRNEVTRMASAEVAAVAASALGDGTTAEEVRAATEPVALTELDVIRISGTHADPARAAALANAVGEAYQVVLRTNLQERITAAQAELRDQLAEGQGRLSTLNAEIGQIEADTRAAVATDPELVSPVSELERQLATSSRYQALVTERDILLAQQAEIRGRSQELSLDLATARFGVDVFEPAQPPGEPDGPGQAFGAILGGFLGLLLGIAWIAYREQTAGQVDDGRSAEALLGTSMIGAIRRTPFWRTERLPTLDQPGSPEADAYHYLVSVMDFALRDHAARTLMVTSARAGDGKTTVTTNLAAAAASDGREVLVIDADERTYAISDLLGVPPTRSVLELADPAVHVADVCTEIALPEGRRMRLVSLPSRDEASGLLRSSRFEGAMARLIRESGADLILLDAPPFAATSDAAALAAMVDGCLLVVRRGTSTRMLVEMRRQMAVTGLPQLGYVFTFDRQRSLAQRRAYGRYYHGRKSAPRAAGAEGRPAAGGLRR